MIVRRGQRDLRAETPSPRELVTPLVAPTGLRPPLGCCGGTWLPLGGGTAQRWDHVDGCPVRAARRAEEAAADV